MLWDPFLIPELFRSPGRHPARRDPLSHFVHAPRPRRVALRGPAIDLRAGEDEARVRVLVPGMAADDLELSVEGDLLTVTGEFRRASEDTATTSGRTERFAGRFTRTIRLPFPTDQARIEASLERGVLNVTLPRAAEDRPRRIEVTSR